MQWITLAIIVVFGGATLVTHDETFIKWKPTLLYWAFASALLLGPLVFKKNPIKAVMGAQLQLPEPVWGKVNQSWMVFFAALGVLNLWVASHFETADWVNFKVFGCTALTLVFVVIQAILLAKHMQPSEEPSVEVSPPDEPI
jgi:intracellular septation protein